MQLHVDNEEDIMAMKLLYDPNVNRNNGDGLDLPIEGGASRLFSR